MPAGGEAQADGRLRALSLGVGRGQHGAGLLLGKTLPGLTAVAARTGVPEGSHINVPIAALIWLMIYPMMLKIDLRSIPASAEGPAASS